MFEGFVSSVMDVAGTSVSYVKGGSGPPVLLLHGFPQTKAMWARVAPILAERYTVIAADLRGYGDSAKPPALPDCSNYSFRAFAQDQAGLMRALGYERFHLIGHDRGGRTGHRMALDHPGTVLSLAVLDIVPTYAMLMDTNWNVAAAYWHWYFLAKPAPFPERLIGADPDYFYETCLVGWGKSALETFEPDMLAEYRRCWRKPDAIRAMTCDYRAAVSIDLAHDTADIADKIECPTLAFWGTQGLMHQLFDMEKEWRSRAAHLEIATLPGGHFFVDQHPRATAERLLQFLDRCSTPGA
jgi:haloacetate dehalogenase